MKLYGTTFPPPRRALIAVGSETPPNIGRATQSHQEGVFPPIGVVDFLGRKRGNIPGRIHPSYKWESRRLKPAVTYSW